ncbi:MAG: YbjQ family protein [Cellvibrionaceae bacterium]
MYDLIVVFILLVLGYAFGQAAEKKHFRSLIKREGKYSNLLTFAKRFPLLSEGDQNAQLVGGNVVISVDYFKRFVAALRNLIGGRVTVYESLLERARREAILRMKEDARKRGLNTIVNVKLETSSITKGTKNQVGAVEVYAYGTGLVTDLGKI